MDIYSIEEQQLLQLTTEIISWCEKLLECNFQEHEINLLCNISKKYNIKIYDLYNLYNPDLLHNLNNDCNLYIKINDEYIQIKKS